MCDRVDLHVESFSDALNEWIAPARLPEDSVKLLDKFSDATSRAIDNTALFVDVSRGPSMEAAERVLRLKDVYPRAEINPVDLSLVLEGTQPLAEHHIERIERVMSVQRPIADEDIPDEIQFAIPNVDVSAIKAGVQPEGHYILPADAYADISYAATRYVHIDSMPDELKRVIRAYLSMRRNSDTGANRRFKEAVGELTSVALKLSDEPLSPGVVCAVEGPSDAVDPHDQ